jgi:membrane-associated phospholipid phosphatase
MIAVWVTLAGFLVVETVWLSLSRLHFAGSNWPGLIHLVLFTAIGLGMCALVSHRLSGVTDRFGVTLREGSRRVELFAITALIAALLSAVIVTYCYLGTAAALPLQDARLSRIDHWLGFDWIGFVEFVNSSPVGSQLLVDAYRSAPYAAASTMLWFCISGQGDRLAEFFALMCLMFIGIAIGMMIWPAEGAYAYYHPPLSIYDNIGAGSGMWHHPLLMALRTGTDTLVDFTTPNSGCLVTFPSGHTVLAVAMTYVLRGSKWTLIPAIVINTTMLVSTIPYGGHHLTDLIAGGAIALCSIFLIRLPLGLWHERRVASGHVALARAFPVLMESEPGL